MRPARDIIQQLNESGHLSRVEKAEQLSDDELRSAIMEVKGGDQVAAVLALLLEDRRRVLRRDASL